MSIQIQGCQVVIENPYIRRVLDLTDGICTKTYHIRPGGEKLGDTWYPVFSFESESPFEAAVTVGGKFYEASPAKREQDNNLWNRPSSFTADSVRTGRGRFGDTVDITLVPRGPETPPLRLTIHYEISDRHPFLQKRVSVQNIGTQDVTVEGLTVDMLRFFNRVLPLSTFTNYTQTDDVKTPDPYYMGWTRMEFPDELDMILAPGESMESFDLYEAATAADRQEESVILHRIYKEIAPWICTLNLQLSVGSCQTTEELYQTVDVAAENGFEMLCFSVGQVFTNTGDYIPRPDLFPDGYRDIKRLVDYCHARGLKTMPHCSAVIAWRNTKVCQEHEDWQCLGPDGLRYDPFGFGNMCYHSPWGDYIREKLFYLLDEIGFDGLALDGPVHGLVCEEKNHTHRSPASVNFMNWMWEKKFYGDIAARGKILTVPEVWNAIFLGANETPGGYREEDQNEFGGMPLVAMTRACVYESRYHTPPCCIWTSFNLEEYHGHSIEASEADTATYEHALAGMLGYGIDNSIYAKEPYIGESTKKVYFKWIGIFKQYRETLLGDFIHIAQPNGYQPDAVLHTRPDAETPALLIVFNPCVEEKTVDYTLPLQYAGLAPGSSVMIEGKRIRLDSVSGASVEISLAPHEVKAVPVTRAAAIE